MRVLQFGCGGVGVCVVEMLSQLPCFDMKQLTIVDQIASIYNAPPISKAMEEGATVIVQKIQRDNWKGILAAHLNHGDLLLDLSFGISSMDLLSWCQEHSVLYINTAIEKWEDELISENELCMPEGVTIEGGWTKAHKQLYDRTLYARHMAIMKQFPSHNGPTAVLEHGCNPGLVSHFVRAALDDIVTSLLCTAHHSDPYPLAITLQRMQTSGQYPQIAKLLGLRVIHISEIDTQTSSRIKRPGEFVNTWSPMGFAEEAIDWVQVGWGSHEKGLPSKTILVPEEGDKHEVFIPMHAMDLSLNSYVPDTPIVGMCIPHGESESITRYFTVQPTDEVVSHNQHENVYRPSVYYVYKCADIASESLEEIRRNGYKPQDNFEVLTERHNIVGEDRVGVLLMFEDNPLSTITTGSHNQSDKKPWAYWYGSILGTHNNPVQYCNPTVVQVASSVVAALQWAQANPNKGVCWPEMLPHKEILANAHGPNKYLGEIISRKVDYNPPSSLCFGDFMCEREEAIQCSE